MTYKAQKKEENKIITLFPVNGVGFNFRNSNFLYTAGADGTINFWDLKSKLKIKTLEFNKQPVSCSKMNGDGQYLAYGIGYDWH